MTYSQIFEWVWEHFDVPNYSTPEELIYDVKNEFAKTNSPFPVQAEELIRERFQYRREFAEMERQQKIQQEVADALGSGKVMKSITDEIVDNLENPRSEIMDIDMTEYATRRETTVPPEIRKFYETKRGIFGRIASGFKRILFGR